MKGTVKWWSDSKGYGFLTDETGVDVFVHYTAIKGSGFRTLYEGETVTFDPVISEKNPSNIQAANVVRGSAEDPTENESDPPVVEEELIAFGLFGNKIKLVSLTKDGTYRFLDDFEKLHNIVYVASSERSALQAAVHELEEMVNDPKAKEKDFQAFFVRNPDFILTDGYKKPHPHIMLTRDDGETLIPDFVLEPVSDSDLADLLELKLPSAPIYVIKKNRPRFSAAVAEACAQLREYSAFFDEEKNRRAIQKNHGLFCYKPKMFVIIGRKGNVNPLEVRRIHSDMPNMYLRTYDDILCRMKFRLDSMR
jgi:cold shock CspA family protein